MDDSDFINWLGSEYPGSTVRVVGDGRWVLIHPLMFHWTLKVGKINDRVGYDDHWCYANKQKAKVALDEWQGRSFAGEPTGWHRNPKTGRRRIEGNPSTEYIDW